MSESTERVRPVHEKVREAILDCDLRPGEPVTQASLSDGFGISKAALRDAILLLAHEGLLEQVEDDGLRVTPIEVEELDELYGARIALEALAVSITVPRMTATDQYALAECLGELNVYSRSRDLEAWERAHRAFHTLLSERAGTRLAAMLDGLRGLCRRYRKRLLAEPRAWALGATEHAAIAAACHRGDVELARYRVARHLARTALTLVTQISPGYEPQAVRGALQIFAKPTQSEERTSR